MVLTRAAVTGASGMVGRHLLSFLASQGVEQVVTSRNRPEYLPESTTWFPWNLTEWKNNDFFDFYFSGVEVIFHVGAMVPLNFNGGSEKDLFEANVRSCLNLGLWAMEREIPVIFLSGAVVYADTEKEGIRESDKRICDGAHCIGGFYGYSKLMAEDVFSSLASKGLRVCILRPSSIYGAGLPENKMLSRFLLTALSGGTIELSPPFEDEINLIHAFDVAKSMWQAYTYEAWGVYNIGKKLYSILDIAHKCVSVAGRGDVKLNREEESSSKKVRFDLNYDKASNYFLFKPGINLQVGLLSMVKHIFL